jgi:hypothetical protein
MPEIITNETTGEATVTGQTSKFREFRRKAWKSFLSKSPKWVIALQAVCGSIGAWGATLVLTHFTIPGLDFVNHYAPYMVEFGAISVSALQFIQRAEAAILGPGETLTNDTDKPVQVDVPSGQ